MTVLAAFVCYGDSNMANSDQYSWFERALDLRYPYYRMCSAGAGLGNLKDNQNVRDQILGHSHSIFAMGTNSWGSSWAVNQPILLGDIAALRAGGVQKILICTLPPSTTSTDDWATAENQSPAGGNSAQVAARLDMNNAIRAMASSPGGANADAVLDAASYVEVNSSNAFEIDGGRWRVGSPPTGSGSSGRWGSGPHYEEYGMRAAAVGGALAIDRLVAGETGFLQQRT